MCNLFLFLFMFLIKGVQSRVWAYLHCQNAHALILHAHDEVIDLMYFETFLHFSLGRTCWFSNSWVSSFRLVCHYHCIILLVYTQWRKNSIGFLLFCISARRCNIKIRVLWPWFSLEHLFSSLWLNSAQHETVATMATSLPGGNDSSDLPNLTDLGLSVRRSWRLHCPMSRPENLCIARTSYGPIHFSPFFHGIICSGYLAKLKMWEQPALTRICNS